MPTARTRPIRESARRLAAKPFIRRSALTVAARFAAAGLGAAGSLLLARHLGATEYGQFSFLNASLNLLLILCVFGGNVHVMRHTRTGGTDAATFDETFASVVGMGIAAITLVLPAAIVLVASGAIGAGADLTASLTAVCILLPLRWIGQLIAPARRIDGRPLAAEMSTALANRTSIPVALGAGVLVGIPATGEAFMLAVAAVSLTVHVPILFGARRILARALRARPGIRRIASTARDCVWHAVNNASQRGFELVPVMTLALLARPEDAGVLNIALKLFLPIMLINQAVSANLQPRVARALNEEGLNRRTVDGVRAISGAVLLVVVAYAAILAAAGDHLLAFVGEEYGAALVPALILTAGRGVDIAAGLNAMLMSMGGYAHTLTAIRISILAAVTAALLLFPDMFLPAVTSILASGWAATGVGTALAAHFRFGVVFSPLFLIQEGLRPRRRRTRR